MGPESRKCLVVFEFDLIFFFFLLVGAQTELRSIAYTQSSKKVRFPRVGDDNGVEVIMNYE